MPTPRYGLNFDLAHVVILLADDSATCNEWLLEIYSVRVCNIVPGCVKWMRLVGELVAQAM